MEATATDLHLRIGSLKPRRKAERWFLAFALQLLVLLLSMAIASVLFTLFFSWPNYLSVYPWFYPVVLVIVTVLLFWAVAILTEGASPGFIRKLVPGNLDKYLLPKPQLSEVEEILGKRIGLKPEELAVAERLIVISEIQERVGRLRLRTTSILTTMGIALVGAAIIVIFAGSLTSIDATAVSNVDKVKSDLTEEQRQLTRLYQTQTQLGQLEEAKKAGNKGDQEKLERQIFGGTSTSGSLPTDPPAIQAMINDGKERIAKLNVLLQTAWTKELETQHGYNDWHYIVATAITRVGVVLIIIYLVQILMGLYRYNTRLTTYYNAKRDVLTLWDGNPASLKRLDEIIGPPKFDFGKEPKHPLEDLLRAAGSKVGAAVSRAKKVEGQV